MANILDINVHHLTRVEGHGNIVVQARDGVVQKVEWQVPEAPRFFEVMVRGRSWEDIQTIVSRICGICSASHSLVALQAIEAAMDFKVSQQTERLRILTYYAEILESHILHIGYLVAPDLLGQKSVIPLARSHPELLKTIISLHRLGNEWLELLAGRMTHPVTFKPGGFSRLPSAAELRALRQRLKPALGELDKLAQALRSSRERLPDFSRDTEYIALVNGSTYPFDKAAIGSSDVAELTPVQEFEKVANEYVSPQSTAKWTKWHRDAYAVGALARFNLNARHLRPLAAQAAQAFGLQPGSCNPFFNTIAQCVECYHIIEHALELIDEVLSAGIQSEKLPTRPRAGGAAAAVEAPRGILFHRYVFDNQGLCLSANLCIPTNQNHANIQKDLEALVPQIISRPPDQVRHILEMLVRAYDPCISCSTHYLDVTFV